MCCSKHEQQTCSPPHNYRAHPESDITPPSPSSAQAARTALGKFEVVLRADCLAVDLPLLQPYLASPVSADGFKDAARYGRGWSRCGAVLRRPKSGSNDCRDPALLCVCVIVPFVPSSVCLVGALHISVPRTMWNLENTEVLNRLHSKVCPLKFGRAACTGTVRGESSMHRQGRFGAVRAGRL